jgi:CopA family copper-resistance protein
MAKHTGHDTTTGITRRKFVGASASLAGLSILPMAATAMPKPLSPVFNDLPVLSGDVIDLTVAEQTINFSGKQRLATTINGSLPAPLIRLREGQTVKIRVHNRLNEDTSIHWHGIILPSNMDGVPGLSFDGIKPGETFTYEFTVNQSGTYWYHSHSGWQDQTGMYGPMVIDPATPEPFSYQREHVVLLSDWSDENPQQILMNLKKQSHYYNVNERTVKDLASDISEKGLAGTWRNRKMWNTMRMSDSDISDVTAYTYRYLMNGKTHDEGWRGLFKPGEKVRLRFINGSAMTFFDVRIPGLKMTIVAADGQLVQPVLVDEFRIGTAEIYDVIIEPQDEPAYTVFAQAMDRSSYALGTLAVDATQKALIPALDAVPVLSHDDMGMSMKTMMEIDPDMDMNMQAPSVSGKGPAGLGSALPVIHPATENGPHVEMQAESPQYRLDDPGVGLREHQQKFGRKVLTYAMLKNYYVTEDKRQPSREIQLHLTGNMYRYQWSIDGVAAHPQPIDLQYGERVRFTLVNDTMMNHPMHLHGLWSELETGDPEHLPRKHTVIVQPGSKISFIVTADAKGLWAFHCHLLFHMASMFRVVRVT